MIKTPSTSLFLDISSKQNMLIISISDENTPFYQSEEISFNFKEIENLCCEVRLLLNKSNTLGRLSSGLLQELKQICHILYDRLLTRRVKDQIKKTTCENLVIRLDEPLVFIPWELLFNGENFLCLAFNVGRRVITTQPLIDQAQRQPRFPLKMLLLADATGDLPGARKEIQLIREHLDCNREILAVSTKTGEITVDYVTRNIRDYDFVHFAGHTDPIENQQSLGGCRLSDGLFSPKEIQNMQGGSAFPLFIFLNSCQSAHIASVNISDDYEQKCFGLVHAFLTAGIRHYVGTLWEIPDSVGLIIASEFYKYIQKGAAIGEALRQARLKAMKEFGEENIVWAGYVLYGDPKYSPFPRGLKSSLKKSAWSKITTKNILLLIIGLLGIVLLTGFILLKSKNIRRPHSITLVDNFTSTQKLTTQVYPANKQNHLTQLTIPSPDDSLEITSLKQHLAQAQKTNNPKLLAQSFCTLADKSNEILLERLIFTPRESTIQESQVSIPDSYFKILNCYHACWQYADNIQDHRLAAHALQASAGVNRWRKEYHSAILDYEKAMESLSSIKSKQESDYFSLIITSIDLAQLYALNNLDFIKAEAMLLKIKSYLIAIKDTDDHGKDLKLFTLRKYDFFIQNLALSRYANSHFASQAQTLHKQLTDTLNDHAQ
ncbi:MAG: CHAT domain-containing protein [Candidatus Omnitrophica bacterium]|nr:CHAT domain-containing protein [Candidatus Omnitrophota bacterium]